MFIDTESEMKFCVDCKHCVTNVAENNVKLYRCDKYRTIDLVTGEFISLGWCADLRFGPPNLLCCGREAVGFEPKGITE